MRTTNLYLEQHAAFKEPTQGMSESTASKQQSKFYNYTGPPLEVLTWDSQQMWISYRISPHPTCSLLEDISDSREGFGNLSIGVIGSAPVFVAELILYYYGYYVPCKTWGRPFTNTGELQTALNNTSDPKKMGYMKMVNPTIINESDTSWKNKTAFSELTDCFKIVF